MFRQDEGKWVKVMRQVPEAVMLERDQLGGVAEGVRDDAHRLLQAAVVTRKTLLVTLPASHHPPPRLVQPTVAALPARQLDCFPEPHLCAPRTL